MTDATGAEQASEWFIGGTSDAAVAELAAFYEYLAVAEFDGYCDLYAAIARGMAGDREALELVASLAAAPKLLPVLVNAAVHHLTLREPDLELAAIYRGEPGDPWPPFRQLLFDRVADIRATTDTHTVQTNEVSRSSVLVAAFTAVHERFDRPLAIIEVGPSAGLNLLFDRYGHTFGDGRTAGDPTSPVQLRCELRGPLLPPLPSAPLPIASRAGIDIDPIDVHDEDKCRWLEACLWPLVPERADRLRAAIEIARTDPPTLHRGTATDLLPGLLDALDPEVVPCIVSTWVLGYFSKDERAAFRALLADAGAQRDLACVTSEYPSVAPWIDRPPREAADNAGQAASILGLAAWADGHGDDRALAWNHAHGTWIDWLDTESSPSVSVHDSPM
jgi:hypothetical protein